MGIQHFLAQKIIEEIPSFSLIVTFTSIYYGKIHTDTYKKLHVEWYDKTAHIIILEIVERIKINTIKQIDVIA